AGLYPATDLPCFTGIVNTPIGPVNNGCATSVDIFNISNLATPTRVSTISTGIQTNQAFIGGANDIAFNFGYLVVTGFDGTGSPPVENPRSPLALRRGHHTRR